MEAISKDTKVTIGALIAIGTLIVSAMKFLPTPGSEKYVNDKLEQVDRRFQRLENQQDKIIDRMDKIYEKLSGRR